jgi:hypothetical protein
VVQRRFFTSGSGSGGPPGRRVELSPEDFGAKCDGRAVDAVSIAESSANLTATGAAFTAADVGKTIAVYGAGLQAHGFAHVTTIASVQSATAVTLTAPAAGTVAASRAVYGTDDSVAIEAAIAEIVTRGITDRSYAGRLWCSNGIYMLTRAPQLGGAYNSHAQVRIPTIADTAQKFDLGIVAGSAGGTFGHWNQTVPQKAGAVFYSTSVGVASDGTYGPPCMVAGPTPTAATWSNMLLTVDGLQFVAQRNPGLTALHAGRIGQLHIKSLGVVADMTPAEMNVAALTNDLGLGVRVPAVGNNHYVMIDRLAVEGFYYGMTITDHLTAGTLVMVYCNTAIFVSSGGAAEHGVTIANLGVEASSTVIEGSFSSDARFPIFVGQCNIETSEGTTFKDTNSGFVGTINFSDNTRAAPTTTGCNNVKIVDLVRPPGAVAAPDTPAVPATTVALKNPFFRDAFVHVAGGTVTAIAVDGRTTGVTSGMVAVPNAKTIAITHSSAPTWVWTLL